MPKTSKFCDFCTDQFGRKIPSRANASGYCKSCEMFIRKHAKTDPDYATLQGVIKMRQYKNERETRRKNYERNRAFRILFDQEEEEEEEDGFIKGYFEAHPEIEEEIKEMGARTARFQQMLNADQEDSD